MLLTNQKRKRKHAQAKSILAILCKVYAILPTPFYTFILSLFSLCKLVQSSAGSDHYLC